MPSCAAWGYAQSLWGLCVCVYVGSVWLCSALRADLRSGDRSGILINRVGAPQNVRVEKLFKRKPRHPTSKNMFGHYSNLSQPHSGATVCTLGVGKGRPICGSFLKIHRVTLQGPSRLVSPQLGGAIERFPHLWPVLNSEADPVNMFTKT